MKLDGSWRQDGPGATGAREVADGRRGTGLRKAQREKEEARALEQGGDRATRPQVGWPVGEARLSLGLSPGLFPGVSGRK